ncbi:MAG: hypothetical protein A2161_07825 [Candidatus Schekmanbacteria bacterium RBG_13_48_7]|uniref:Galactose oxidase n=1 Tax=Candidatus Schekmanbacteria bacterium RBG_13_48_7 TaxID=1817878 RepID=A0A1F7RPV6_9BACT|nr:MAG: hypothetical protein A2161_07825 [Candidatus Schekmanbacteria bacterium RBG_13_48_7]
MVGIAGIAFLFWWWTFARTFYPLDEYVETKHGIYSTARELPIAITEAGGTVCNNKFYVAGGLGAFAQTLDTFFEYDPGTDRWQELLKLPQQISHAGVVTHNNKIYIVGGFGPLGIRIRGFMFAEWKPLKTVYIYDTVSGSWKNGPELPEPRGAGGIAVTGDTIWFVGGINQNKNISDSFFKFDIEKNVWESLPSMPTPRDHLRLEAIDDNLYAISGRKDDLRFNLSNVECYNILTGQWTKKTYIPLGRGGFASVVYHGRIYTFGGEHVWKCFTNVERYDPESDTWKTLSPMPEPRHGIIAGIINDEIHLVSGGIHPRISVSAIHRVFNFID